MPSTVLQELQRLQRAQETRLALYQEFEDAYQDYLNDRCPEEQYSSICRIVTEGFQEVSQEIQGIETQLRDTLSRPDLAQQIRRLQMAEKAKLNHVVHIQIYTIESKKGEKDYDATVAETRQTLKQTLDEIQEVWDDIRQELTDLAYS
ncbi:DNA repair REX1-B-domain-containing protein [Gongronella butleri]|nr:DNA repair REX1-B-domain-containing protein [Gongronella butleri]